MFDINEYSYWLNQLFISKPLYRVLFIANIAFNLGIFSTVFFNFITYRKQYSIVFFITSAGITFTHLSLFLYIFGVTNPQQFYLSSNLTHIVMTIVMYIYFIKLLKLPISKSIFIICFVHALLSCYVSFSFPAAAIRPLHLVNVVLKITIFGLLIKIAYNAYKENEVDSIFFQIGIVIIGTTVIMIFPPIVKHPQTYVYPIKFITLFINTLSNAGLIGCLSALVDKQFTMQQVEVIKLADENHYLLFKQKTMLEQQVAERTLELQKSNTLKDKLFATIGHDLRNAVVILKTSLTIFDKKTEDNTHQMQKQVDGLYTTLDNLLEWSVLQLNRDKTILRWISIKDNVDDCLDFLSYNLRQKNIRVILALETTDIYTNEHHLSIILRNLVSNAIKFTPVNGFIRISASNTNTSIELTITDTGIGIPPALLATLFSNTSFQSRTGTRGEKGTGLGLKLCKELIDNQGGILAIESEENKGTSVIIRFLS